MTEWKEFSVAINNEAAEAVSSIFTELGSSGVSISDRNDFLHMPEYGNDTLWELDEENFPKDGVVIKGYFTEHDDLDQINDELTRRVKQLADYGIMITHLDITMSDVKEEDWSNAWKKYYHPVNITRFLTIVPQWETYEKRFDDERIVYLDPGLAFGTGTHPTTQLCIQALETYVFPEAKLFDVGTGSGVLSIAADLYGAKEVRAYDLDEVAVTSAKDNIRLNQLEDRIDVQANNLLKDVSDQADIIVANILTEVILPFIPDAYAHLEDDGLFITSGIILDKKDEVIESLIRHDFDILQVNQMKDWVAVIAKKTKKEE
ncbi:ribosomal protein L11 methyltransferase [Alkalibacterium subtropicum]|uniref:Ribosomal protein L11 methyltransferase n=1 Tax=Alkalibacterium subtropicum TaxID=753702 RepID=A0A1I1EX08_9LACT|nr:50S ribosomal protein L11 methyltransferase [Alkalibacterium subtropicum]SFB91256.1 ribosomal protein L11 methyltransferase [Alkalibacterium subtropicum]